MSDTTETTTRLSDQFREAADCLSTARREFAELSLRNLEQTLDSVIDYERSFATAMPIDWLREALVVRTAFLNEAKTSYLRAARAVLVPTIR